jgi:hypothetical protein
LSKKPLSLTVGLVLAVPALRYLLTPPNKHDPIEYYRAGARLPASGRLQHWINKEEVDALVAYPCRHPSRRAQKRAPQSL